MAGKSARYLKPVFRDLDLTSDIFGFFYLTFIRSFDLTLVFGNKSGHPKFLENYLKKNFFYLFRYLQESIEIKYI
ncbi:hypothetical protein BpHYR1_046995 [Brachionus plicatilis]|uniref:Uncharacterized protein n=1 Tax=Brachionus plicatilis TaxID=10195 RepID=A0A3M7SE02_BRAPC|nr:hypothetical protein BpHYR1_046995 [Brachionus plicatilis]